MMSKKLSPAFQIYIGSMSFIYRNNSLKVDDIINYQLIIVKRHIIMNVLYFVIQEADIMENYVKNLKLLAFFDQIYYNITYTNALITN